MAIYGYGCDEYLDNGDVNVLSVDACGRGYAVLHLHYQVIVRVYVDGVHRVHDDENVPIAHANAHEHGIQ